MAGPAELRGRFDYTEQLGRTLRQVVIRATEDPNRRTRRVLSTGLPEIEPTDFESRQIVAKDFRTALGVGATAAGVRFTSAGIEGYNSSVVKTFDIGTDGSGSLGTGATQITWGTSGAVSVPGDALVAGSVTGSKIANDTITNALLKAGAQPYNSTVLFTGTAYNAYSWSAGNIAFADGATQAISGGSNSGLSDSTTYYVYATIGSTSLTQTTTYSDVYSDSRVLLAIIVVGTSSSGSAPTILPFASRVPTISAVAIAANSITADAIQSNSVTAAKISAGAITSDKINVSSLSAISANLGSVTAGTVTGATIRSASSGNRVEINSGGLTIHGALTTLLQFRPVADGSVSGSILGTSGGILFTTSIFVNNTIEPQIVSTGSVGASSNPWPHSYIEEMHTDVISGRSGSVQIHTTAGANTIGFFGATPVVRQSVSGSRGGNAALADLLTSLAALGLIVDSTTA